MRNCDARMTGEVHKRFHRQRRNWSVLPKRRTVIAALVACIATYSGTVPTLRAAPQQNVSGSNSDRVSRAPVITAKPERLAISRRAAPAGAHDYRQRAGPGGLHSGRKLNLLPGPHQRAAEGTAQRPITLLVAAEQLGNN